MGFYDLAALGSLLASLVFYWALRVLFGRFRGAVRPASWPPIIKWMWRLAWMLWLLAVITFVVLRIRYPVGGDITISPNVPLMEHILQVLALGGVVGGFIIVQAWWLALAIYETRVRKAPAIWQQLSQRPGNVAVVIALLIMTLFLAAAAVFVIIVLVLIINVLRAF